MNTTQESTQIENALMVPPSQLLAVKNIRFGLKKYKVDALAAQIKEFGRVHTPLTVYELEEQGPKGELYGIIKGHYRTAAASKAGVMVPVMVEAKPSELDRIKEQVSENLDRENLSAMDTAVAIKGMLDNGMTKTDIRQRFIKQRGSKSAPMSNAMLNIYLSFLEFPKKIQEKLDSGELGVEAGYELSKSPREKWDSILAIAEADQEKQEKWEEKIETKFLDETRKLEAAEAKAKQDKEALQAAEKLAEAAREEAETRQAKVVEAVQKALKEKDPEKRKVADEHKKAAETELKAAEKAAKDAKDQAEKLRSKAEQNSKLAEERKAKLEAARKSASSKPVKSEDIKKAAAKESGGPIPLNAVDMRGVASELALPGSFPKVQLIGASLKRCFEGAITTQQLFSELAYITGERKEKPKTWKEDKPAKTAKAS